MSPIVSVSKRARERSVGSGAARLVRECDARPVTARDGGRKEEGTR